MGSSPTKSPTKNPTRNPSKFPTRNPTKNPTKKPTPQPTKKPTPQPTRSPTKGPTKQPTRSPTQSPTHSPTTRGPTHSPTVSPTRNPTAFPTKSPSASPTTVPALLGETCVNGVKFSMYSNLNDFSHSIDVCEQLGQSQPVINNVDDFNAVAALRQKIAATTNFWIGIANVGVAGSFNFAYVSGTADNSGSETNFLNNGVSGQLPWALAEPDGSGICVSWDSKLDGFADNQCDALLGTICQSTSDSCSAAPSTSSDSFIYMVAGIAGGGFLLLVVVVAMALFLRKKTVSQVDRLKKKYEDDYISTLDKDVDDKPFPTKPEDRFSYQNKLVEMNPELEAKKATNSIRIDDGRFILTDDDL